MVRRMLAGVTATGGAAAVYVLVVGSRRLRRGATGQESGGPLPGDDLIAGPDLTATGAITVRAPAGEVWPWMSSSGRDVAGSIATTSWRTWSGCDVHSADRIVPEWQDVMAANQVRLAPQANLAVALEEGGHWFCAAGSRWGTPPPYDFTWAFVLQDGPAGTTRLLVRERYAYTRPWARLLVEPVEAVSFVMSRKMPGGIRDRAENAAAPTPESGTKPMVRPDAIAAAGSRRLPVAALADHHCVRGRIWCAGSDLSHAGRCGLGSAHDD